MKTVILAGGLGSRISEESTLRPKPMIEIGGRPILWHIMKMYSAHGINDFVICAGYKGFVIKEYFANYFLHSSDASFDLRNNTMRIHRSAAEPWTVTVVDTGETTMTGGRLKRVREHLEDGDFCFTYGDGLSDVNISELIAFHKKSQTLATVTAVSPPSRYGSLAIEHDKVVHFREKPEGEGWINGGFFVLSPKAIDLIDGDDSMWEHEPLERLVRDGQLSSYQHGGFWQPMDTLRDKVRLEELWASGSAPWKVW